MVKKVLKKIYANTIESNCIKTPYSDISTTLKKGICSNLFVYQFIFGKQVLYAHINLDSINIYPGCNQFFLENNPEISKMFSDVKLERERMYTPEQLEKFEALKKDPEFMEVFNKHK